MEIFSTIINIPITQLFVAGLLIVILQRAGIDIAGLIKSLFGKKNGNGNKITEQLDEIESNHLHTIESKIDDLKEGQIKTNELLFETSIILKDFKQDGIKIRN